jgi:hypothetical protein
LLKGYTNKIEEVGLQIIKNSPSGKKGVVLTANLDLLFWEALHYDNYMGFATPPEGREPDLLSDWYRTVTDPNSLTKYPSYFESIYQSED